MTGVWLRFRHHLPAASAQGVPDGHIEFRWVEMDNPDVVVLNARAGNLKMWYLGETPFEAHDGWTGLQLGLTYLHRQQQCPVRADPGIVCNSSTTGSAAPCSSICRSRVSIIGSSTRSSLRCVCTRRRCSRPSCGHASPWSHSRARQAWPAVHVSATAPGRATGRVSDSAGPYAGGPICPVTHKARQLPLLPRPGIGLRDQTGLLHPRE